MHFRTHFYFVLASCPDLKILHSNFAGIHSDQAWVLSIHQHTSRSHCEQSHFLILNIILLEISVRFWSCASGWRLSRAFSFRFPTTFLFWVYHLLHCVTLLLVYNILYVKLIEFLWLLNCFRSVCLLQIKEFLEPIVDANQL